MTKGQHQKNSHGSYFEECLDDILEHDDVYPHHRLLTQKQDEVYPTEEYAQGTELPLPAGKTLQLEVAHKDYGCHVKNTFHIVDEMKEIVSAMVNDLDNLNDDPCYTIDDDND